ncbi:pentatricopeptide repeat-containing protein, mitochondrial-like protein [Cinnamomum micranthum f. kanehirae]|uniref:Pentatricopeptide repeat-containing protein, mitochondrial-like protein n=1 Tax=Cinnamomum micranthum f. kanehirae TaxID=337451 RepID=A0A443N6F2_9MAGN|nr:pentatricopeptide repeat-containing protein, mitochondrial-like protein [Cinnamomum micranthum f. kanehirae]
MASLPSVAVNSTIKLEHEVGKLSSNSFSNEKNLSISYQRRLPTAPAEKNPDSQSLDFQEALSILKEGTKIRDSRIRPSPARMHRQEINVRSSNASYPYTENRITSRSVSVHIPHQCLCKMWHHGICSQDF